MKPVNTSPPSTLCSQLFSESNWIRTDTEQCGEADGAGEPQRRAWEVCQWDGGAEITTPRVGTQSPVLWFEQPVRVLSHASRHSYEVCSYIFLLHEMKTEDPVLPGMPCDIVISATLSSLLAMGNLPSFCVCFLPILGFGWFKPFNSLVLKQTPLKVCGPLQRCAPSPGPFFSDSRRVRQPGKNQDCSLRRRGKTIPTSEGQTAVNNFGHLFSQWNVAYTVFSIQYLNNHNGNTLHTSDVGQVQFSSVTQSCPTLCNPMDCSTPGLSVHHQLPEFTQTHVHWVGDAIQPSHPLSSPSSPALNLSQHQGFFQWVSSLHHVAKVLEFQLQHQSFQWTPRTDLL